MTRPIWWFPAALVVFGAIAVEAQTPAKPPVAREAPSTVEIHGKTLVDPYSWMDNTSDADLLAYVDAPGPGHLRP